MKPSDTTRAYFCMQRNRRLAARAIALGKCSQFRQIEGKAFLGLAIPARLAVLRWKALWLEWTAEELECDALAA